MYLIQLNTHELNVYHKPALASECYCLLIIKQIQSWACG